MWAFMENEFIDDGTRQTDKVRIKVSGIGNTGGILINKMMIARPVVGMDYLIADTDEMTSFPVLWFLKRKKGADCNDQRILNIG
jgi:hypothetical protein